MFEPKLHIADVLTNKSFFIILLLTPILFTYGMDNNFFYLNWGVGLIILIFTLFSLFLIKLRINKTQFKIFIIMNLWLSWALLITPFATNIRSHFTFILLTVFYNALSVFFMGKMLKSKRLFALTSVGLNFSWSIISSIALVYFLLTSRNDIDHSFSGIFANRNQFAVVTTLLFTFLLLNKKYFSNKLLINILLGMNIILVFMSLSRKGFLGIILILFIFNWQKLKGTKKYFAIAVILLLVAGTLLTDNPLKDRFQLVKQRTSISPNERVELSAFERLWLLINGTKLFLKHPLTGVGVNNSKVFLETPMQKMQRVKGIKMDKGGRYSHINYLEMLLNGGVPAFLLYYIPIFFVLFKSLSMYKNDEIYKSIVILLVYKLFLDIAMVSYYDFAHSLLLAFVFISYYNIYRKTEIDHNPDILDT